MRTSCSANQQFGGSNLVGNTPNSMANAWLKCHTCTLILSLKQCQIQKYHLQISMRNSSCRKNPVNEDWTQVFNQINAQIKCQFLEDNHQYKPQCMYFLLWFKSYGFKSNENDQMSRLVLCVVISHPWLPNYCRSKWQKSAKILWTIRLQDFCKL